MLFYLQQKFYTLKQDDKITILYHILYFEFIQNSVHTLSQFYYSVFLFPL
nr:MAG TPA: hypothetical protein [Caudoviricetes sp.]